MSWNLEDFENTVIDITGGNKKFPTNEYLSEGMFPIVDQAEGLVAGFVNSAEIVKRKKPVVIFGDHTKHVKYIDFDFCLGADGVKVLEPLDKVDPKFLFFFLGSINLPDVGYSRHYKFLKEIKIPVPPISIQKKLAAILDKADSLRQKDKQLLAKYDELTQSIFYKMFGDPGVNDKGWKKGTIRNLVAEVKYGTSKPSEESGEFIYLRMNNITYNGRFDFTNLKYINLTGSERAKYLVRKGDLLFNRTNSKELVGKTAVYKGDIAMAIAGYLIRVRANELANTDYISAYLNSKHGKLVLSSMCKSIVGMANINAQELQEIKILIPPRNLQDQFSAILDKIEAHKGKINVQLQKSEELFQCLLQKAFAGEIGVKEKEVVN